MEGHFSMTMTIREKLIRSKKLEERLDHSQPMILALFLKDIKTRMRSMKKG